MKKGLLEAKAASLHSHFESSVHANRLARFHLPASYLCEEIMPSTISLLVCSPILNWPFQPHALVLHILKIKHLHFYHSHVEYFELEVKSYLANKLTAFSLVQQLHPVNVIGALHRFIAK